MNQKNHDYFQYLGKSISTQEITSMLPYFDCDEPGHDGNALDQVCLQPDCKFKGLTCIRCQYQRHRMHPTSIYPLHTFVSKLITEVSSKKLVLEEQVEKCLKYREVVISIIKEHLNQLIDHMVDFVAQMYKYYTSFENSYENVLIRSSIIAHSLIYKKHIKKDQFQKYLAECVKHVQFDQQSQKRDDYYYVSQSQPQTLEQKFEKHSGNIIIEDQEKAFQMTQEYIDQMQQVAKKLQNILETNLGEIQKKAQLHLFSDKIPRFEKAHSIEEIQNIKEQFGVNINYIFGNSQQQSESSSKKLNINNSTIFSSYNRNQPGFGIDSYEKHLAPVLKDDRLEVLDREYLNQIRQSQQGYSRQKYDSLLGK